MRTARSGHLAFLMMLGCGEGNGPTNVTLGETTFVVMINPPLNDANQIAVPAPGSTRTPVTVAVASGPSGVTDGNGNAVLRPITAGDRMLSFSGTGVGGQLSATIAERDLQEIAISTTGAGAAEMARVVYGFGGTVSEVTPVMTIQQVNDQLARSNLIVLVRSGSYTGNLVFAGSNVTLFGEGPSGGTVTLNGNVTVSGSQNRMRGVRVTGNMTVPGSSFGMSFSRVNGSFGMAGSNGVLLNNAFCGSVTVSGSGAKLIGNAGLTPVSASSGGC